MRTRAVLGLGAVAAVAATSAVAGVPARASFCVNVVVDDGTHTPTRHCTTTKYGDTAASVLAARASEVHQTAPRYDGNFLCAIDGYPESGCGNHGTEPYWSFWIWVRGAWTYSQVGVDSYAVEDGDHDGRPDPLGFRYTPFESKERPRAGVGLAPTPAPTPKPSPTPAALPPVSSAPPAPSPRRDVTSAPAVRQSPAATGSRSTGSRPTPSHGPSATGSPVVPDAVEPAAAPRRHGGVPTGTLAAAAIAAGLLGATAWRFRAGRS